MRPRPQATGVEASGSRSRPTRGSCARHARKRRKAWPQALGLIWFPTTHESAGTIFTEWHGLTDVGSTDAELKITTTARAAPRDCSSNRALHHCGRAFTDLAVFLLFALKRLLFAQGGRSLVVAAALLVTGSQLLPPVTTITTAASCDAIRPLPQGERRSFAAAACFNEAKIDRQARCSPTPPPANALPARGRCRCGVRGNSPRCRDRRRGGRGP